MLDFACLPLDERTPYFVEVANRRRLSPLFVEKDFWVCFTLHVLFSSPELTGKFVFKGGTSLSKVFGVTHRFSEDIDLSIDPMWLGFSGDKQPEAANSRSQFEKRWKKLNTACAEAVEHTIQPTLKKAIMDALGENSARTGCLTFKLDEQTHSPILSFRYPTTEPERSGYVHPQVKLEMGSLTDQRPIGSHTVTSWVAEEFPDRFGTPTSSVVALEVERTFWEKVTILHTEYHRPSDKPMRARLSRDYYDVCQMSGHPAGKRAMTDLDLLARVVTHKKMYFKSGWASYGSAVPGTLHLVPPDHRLADLKADYHQMQPMFTTPPPSFEEILGRLRSIESTINGQSE